MENSKELYVKLCSVEKSIPLAAQPWRLDMLVGPDNWNVVIVKKNDEIIASLTYVIKKKFGLVVLSQPPSTQALGPWFKNLTDNFNKNTKLQNDLLPKLIEGLPRFDQFQQNWNYHCTNWLPLYWKSYQQTTRYTYVLRDLSDLHSVFNNFDPSYRNKIRKAEKIVTVKHNLSIEEFYKINSLTFSRQKISMPYSLDQIKKMDEVLAEKKQREIFYAIDSLDQIHSAIYLTWDSQSSYLHMVGEDPALRSSGAGILLIWEAIKYTQEVLKLNCFDFEGSMIKNIESVRRDFGAVQMPYFTLSKTNSKLLKFYYLLRS